MPHLSRKHRPILTAVICLLSLLSAHASANSPRVSNLLDNAEKNYRTGLYDSAIASLYELLEFKDVDNKAIIRSYILLGNSYSRLQKDNTASLYLEKARELLPAIKNRVDEQEFRSIYCELEISLSSVCIQKGDFDKARTYLRTASGLCGADPNLIGKIYQNEAMIFERSDNLEKAEEYDRKALALVEDPYAKAIIRNNLAVIYAMQSRYGEALNLLAQNDSATNDIEAMHIQSNICMIRSQIYARLGDYKQAYENRLLSEQLNDSIFNKRREENILEEKTRYETLRIADEKKMIAYELQITRLKNFRNILLLVLALCLLAAVTVFTLRKIIRQRRANRKLKKEISAFDETKDQYESEIDSHTRKLMASVVYTTETRNAASNVVEDLKRLEALVRSDGEASSLVTEIKEHLKPLTADSLGWDDFKIYFEKTHPTFFAELYKAFPTLTLMEHRLCAFIVMNLSTKEIARLTSRSIRTVETSKFRLRKKIGIPHGVSLLQFLQQFLMPQSDIKKTDGNM